MGGWRAGGTGVGGGLEGRWSDTGAGQGLEVCVWRGGEGGVSLVLPLSRCGQWGGVSGFDCMHACVRVLHACVCAMCQPQTLGPSPYT